MSLEPSPERRYVQKAVDILIQWSPLGGSLGILIHSVMQQNWILTAFTFPVMLITVIWAKYTEHFTERFGEIAGERGRRDADSVAALLSRLDQAVRLRLSGFDGKYLKVQANACRRYIHDNEVSILHGNLNPELDSVFVPLMLSDEFCRSFEGDMLPSLPGLQRHEVEELAEVVKNHGSLDIWQFLARTRTSSLRSLAILAWGGSGKTTLLRHLTYCLCTRPRATRRHYNVPEFVPVLIYLRKWRGEIAKFEPPNLHDLIVQHHIPDLPEGKRLVVPPDWANTLLNSGRALIMIDGFDEVAQDQRVAVSQWIAQQMQDYSNAVFILTSRPSAYNRDFAAEKPQLTLKVEPFDQEQRQQFVDRWHLAQEQNAVGLAGRTAADVKDTAERRAADLLAQIESRDELEDMAQNPLMLSMIAMFHRTLPGDTLPSRRAELYRDICSLQLGNRPLAKRVDLLLPAERSQRVLQAVALSMTLNGEETTLSDEEVLGLISEQLRLLDEDVDAEPWLEQIVTVSELVIRKDDGYEFAHRSFQEYLTAAELERTQQEDVVLAHFTEEFWQGTILLYVSLLRRPDGLIARAYELGADAIAFAYDCCKMNPKVSPALVAQLNQRRYERLEEYLRTGKWQAADWETFNLMYQTLGRRWRVEGLRNFPYEDLLRLDGLRVKYSNGKFGFSVQKNIYVSPDVGGIADGRYDAEAWNKFCHAVGWKVDEEYIIFDQNKVILISAPDGQLPEHCYEFVGEWGEVFYDVDGFSSLVSRLVNCIR